MKSTLFCGFAIGAHAILVAVGIHAKIPPIIIINIILLFFQLIRAASMLSSDGKKGFRQ